MTQNKSGSFFKVDNFNFYTNFNYPALNKTRNEIRLLRVDALGRDKHELISNVPVQESPKFSALSYVCGSPKNPVAINVNGHDFNAFANLAAAIDDVRGCWQTSFPGRKLLLWTDQICINQNDDDERSHQVSMMRETYSNAEMTLVQLPASLDTGYDFETWSQGKRWFEGRLQELILAKFSGDGPQFEAYDKYQLIADSPKFATDTIVAWQELFALASSKWWSRAWVFQGFLASPTVYFLWKPFLVPWEDIHDLWNRYVRRSGLLEHWMVHAEFQIESQEAVLRRHFHLKGLSNFCSEGCNYCGAQEFFRYQQLECEVPELCNICDRRLDQALGRQISIVRDVNGIRHKFNKHYEGFRIILQTKENPAYFPARLDTFLFQSRYRETSEARDRIYAYIGLMGPSCSMIPSYRKPLNSILCEAAREIIENSEHLNILSATAELDRVSPPNDPLPSWVPAWTKIDWADPIWKPRMDPCCFGHIAASKPVVKFLPDELGRENRVLLARGIKVDVLEKITSKAQLAAFSGPLESVSICSTLFAQPGDEVWALCGASKLHVFRRTEHRAKLVSEAYVLGGLGEVRSQIDNFILQDIEIE